LSSSVLRFKIQYVFFDYLLLGLVFFLYLFLSAPKLAALDFVLFTAVLSGFCLLVLYLSGAYDISRIFRISHNFRLCFLSNLALIPVALIFLRLWPVSTVSAFTVSPLFLLVSLFFLFRYAFSRVLMLRIPRKNVLIYGAGWAGREIALEIQAAGGLRMNLVGFIDDAPEKADKRLENLPVLGDYTVFADICESYDVNMVVFAVTKERQDHLFFIKSEIEQSDNIECVEMPELFERITGRVPVMHVNNTWHDFYTSLRNRQPYLLYRVLNIGLALFFSLLFLPLLPFVALLIRLTSPGPILYSQLRVGWKEKKFTLYKFRTMRVDAEKNGAVWACNNDPRLTPVGGFLRKTRLDEIPQLYNIFCGDMNFVGPRPERPEFVKDLNKRIPFYRCRHQIAPGLTGWAQVRMGYVNSIDDTVKKLQYDLFYIKNRSLLLDFLILLKTVQVVLCRKGT
jgi:exopolysaccharide biosynthesis polyprenyl glycosylphosphotransferase